MSKGVRVVAVSGGVGGAKLALGLYRTLPPDCLMVVCNTGDDFEHLGLSISPDLDTVLYTLAGIANPETGWGCAHETWTFMQALEQLGGAVDGVVGIRFDVEVSAQALEHLGWNSAGNEDPGRHGG